MKSFKQFLIEQKQEVQCDLEGVCRTIRTYESAGNEKKFFVFTKIAKTCPLLDMDI